MPPDNDEIEQLKERKLCFQCVGDSFLKTEIEAKGTRAECSYCKKTRRCYSIGAMAERVETAFDQHYTRTDDQPDSYQSMLLSDKESDYEWERGGEEVVYAIMNAADIPENAAGDIQKILEDKFSDFEADKIGEETEFASDSYYEEKGTGDGRWQDEWQEFERSLKTEARFFSRTGAHLLASVFDGIDAMRTRDGRSMIVDAGPNTNLNAFIAPASFSPTTGLRQL
jgi:hypothetical protein